MKYSYLTLIVIILASCSSLKVNRTIELQKFDTVVVWSEDFGANITFNDTTIYFSPFGSSILSTIQRKQIWFSIRQDDRTISAKDSIAVYQSRDRLDIRVVNDTLVAYRFYITEQINANIYINPDQYSEVRGGMTNLYRNVIYPETARRNNDQGTTIVEVTIDDRGKVIFTKIARSSGYRSLDQAALSAILRTDFIPGRIGTQPVYSVLNMPISFKLQ
jgi:protein TonB